MPGFYSTEPVPAHVFDGRLGALGGLFLERLWASHGAVDLPTHEAHERLDRFVVVHRGQMSQRTARRRHANAWYLPPLDHGHGVVHEV